jgi:hypothetical protein
MRHWIVVESSTAEAVVQWIKSMPIVGDKRTGAATGIQARIVMLVSPGGGLLFPFALKGFTAGVTRIIADGAGTLVQTWLSVGGCVALAFAVALIAMLAAMSLSAIDRPSAGQLRGKRKTPRGGQSLRAACYAARESQRLRRGDAALALHPLQRFNSPPSLPSRASSSVSGGQCGHEPNLRPACRHLGPQEDAGRRVGGRPADAFPDHVSTKLRLRRKTLAGAFGGHPKNTESRQALFSA